MGQAPLPLAVHPPTQLPFRRAWLNTRPIFARRRSACCRTTGCDFQTSVRNVAACVRIPRFRLRLRAYAMLSTLAGGTKGESAGYIRLEKNERRVLLHVLLWPSGG